MSKVMKFYFGANGQIRMKTFALLVSRLRWARTSLVAVTTAHILQPQTIVCTAAGDAGFCVAVAAFQTLIACGGTHAFPFLIACGGR